MEEFLINHTDCNTCTVVLSVWSVVHSFVRLLKEALEASMTEAMTAGSGDNTFTTEVEIDKMVSTEAASTTNLRRRLQVCVVHKAV